MPVLGCRVDPTIELLSVLALLGGARDGALVDHAYGREARGAFAPFAEHPAVRRAAAVTRRGGDDLAAQLAARVTPPPALAPRTPLRAIGDGPAAVPVAALDTLLAEARDFARRSRFAAFFGAHAAFYQSLCDRVVADSALAPVVPELETYFATRAAGYELVLMPLQPRLGVASPTTRAGPSATLRAYVGPGGVRDDAPQFRTGWPLARVVLHEFAHQHVNAAVRAAAPALARSQTLFAPARDRLRRVDGVASWTGAVIETVVRAAVAEMRGAAAGEGAERAELREQRASGFALVDSVAATLRAARGAAGVAAVSAVAADWWPATMPRVVATLDRVAASPAALAVADPPFDAGMAQALLVAAPDSVVLVLPTDERDAATRDSLAAHVRRVRDRTLPRATILTDREALARDLGGFTIWAIGTMRGNAWLRAHADAVPAQIDAARVVAGGSYAGSGLVFVGAVPSPLDARRPLLLTIGQRADELARGWWVVASDYAVVDGTTVVARGALARGGGRLTATPDSTPLAGAPAPTRR